MAEKQTIIIEEIAKVDSVLDGIKKIQQGFNGLTVPKDLQRQFEEIYKKIGQQAEKAKQAASSGFETRGDVKKFLDALSTMSRLYSELETKAGRLDAEKLAFGDAKGLKDFEDQLKSLKKELDDAKQSAADFGDSIKDKVQAGFDKINGYKNKKSVFKEWAEAQDALYKNNDIDGFKKKIQEIGAEFEKLKTQGIDLEKSAVWSGKYNVYQDMMNVLKEYEQEQQNVITKEQEYNDKVKQKQDTIDATKSKVDNLTAATKEAADAAQQVANSERQVVSETQRLNSELEHFKNKAAYFFGMSNAINLFKRSLRSAYNTVKDLDAVMTETAVVTNFSVSDMWSQLPEYTQRANELGVTIHDTYEAATLFYQQGLKTNEVMQISNETLKMARIAGLDAATASDRMTNALRGFNMELDKTSAQRVNDVYSKLAAITASNTDEISTAMTKVASLAHNANMEFETTAAFLAQIIESTRESAETAGTALKTVVARFSEVKKLYSKGELLGQDEEGEEIDVNKVSTALRSAGINLNEYLTGAKGLDDIFMELAEKWDSLDQVQQRYIATMAAGSRQQSRFIALMSDYKRTVQLVEAANNANGASEEQYGKTLDSLQTKLARLKNAWNEFILGLANSDVIKGAVDLLTNLITAINNLIKAISGKNAAAKIITTFFTAFTTFKIGAKAFGKSSMLSGFFAKLLGDGQVLATGSASKIVKAFYSTLSTSIADFDNKGGITGAFSRNIGSSLNGLYKYFTPTSNKQFFDNLYNNFDFDFNVGQDKLDKFYETVGNSLNKGTLTVGNLNDALKECGQNIQITDKNAEKLGITMENDNSVINTNTGSIRRFSAAATMAGAAMLALGSYLEKQEGPAKNWGTVIKGLGIGLLTFGTIMSVYLPLQAQLMAKGVTSAIVSIPIVGWIAAIISALIALGVAISGLIKNNSLETKLEKSQEATKAAAQAADEAKESYEKLGQVWKELDAKTEAIENATKGTQDWRDAVNELNDAVLELMNTYEGVEVKRNANGVLEVTNKEAIDERERNRMITASAVTNVSRINTLNLDQQMRNKGNQSGVMDYQEYKYLIDYLESQGMLEQVARMTEEESGAIIDKYFKENGWDYGPAWSMRDQGAKDLIAYAKGTTQGQVSLTAERAALGSDILRKANIDQDLQKYANTFLSDDYIDRVIEKNNEKVQELTGINLKNAYAGALGYSDYTEYKSMNPEAEEASELEMRNYILTQKVLDEASGKVQEFANNISGFSEASKALFTEQEGGALTKEQIDELRKEDKATLYKQYGGEDFFETQEEFEEWLSNTLNIAENNFDTSKYGEKFNEILYDSFSGKLTSGAFANLADNLWSVYTTSGEKGMRKIQNSVVEMTQGMDSDKIEAFTNAIAATDWTSVEQVESLKELAREYGVSEEEIERFTGQLIEFNNAVKQVNLEQINKGLALAQKIASGEQGRSFSKEDYETAIANGANKDDFKYNIETEAYDYIGSDIQDVSAAIREGTGQIIAQLDKEYASALAFEKTQNSDWAKGNNWTGNDSDLNNKEKLRSFLNAYNNEAGEDSLVDRDFIFSANLEQLQEKYQEIKELYDNRTDIKQNLDDVTASQYQASSGSILAELAATGDEAAVDALKQQIINSGLSEAIIQALLEDVESGEAETIKSTGNVVGAIQDANSYGIETEQLEQYAEALRTVDGLEEANIGTLITLAAANAKYQEGFKNVIESYDEWIELKQEDGSIHADPTNLDEMKAIGDLKKNLKEMFNLSEDVSDEFLEMPGIADLLEKAVNGDTDAVSELRAELAKAQAQARLIELGIDPNSQNEIMEQIDNMMGEAGTLEFGATLNDSAFAEGLLTAMEAAGMTVGQMQEMFNSLGWAPELDYELVDVADAEKYAVDGQVEIADPENPGKTKMVPTHSVSEFATNDKIAIPRIGNATFVKPSMPDVTPSTSSGGGGGGGGSEKKPSYWENPYDELYNLQEKINEALRKREALERRYQKLLKQEQATLSDIRKSYYDQIEHLGTEADLQKQLAEGRLRQIKKLGNELYTDEDGDRVSYKEMGVTKYASYDEKTGLIKIDWNALEEISNDSDRTEEGKAAEEYISKLEELVSSYEEVRDKLWEIEDTIEQLREDAIQSYISFEDRVMDALINQYQKQIDSYQSMSDALEEANNEVLDSLREQIDLSRQIRDNTEKEQDIADMENRLAYLQRDTSGANDLEILKLQKNLDDARQSYTDTLIDQAISNMEKDASLAAEQRTKQIQIMQAQLDMAVANGTLWKEVHDIINDAADENGALSPQSNLIKLLEESEGYKSLSAIGKEDWLQKAAEEFHKAWVGLNEAEDKFKVDANSDGTIYDTSTPTENTNSNNSGFKWDTTEKRKRRGDGKHKWSAFKTGGLADYTGPAWLDGTKTNPELILNAQDSANFIALKDILASLLNIQGTNGKVGKGGDNYFDIDISATLESDYDVDKLTEKIKRDIYNDGQYRNVNTINYLR